MTFLLASLSTIEITTGKFFLASVLLVLCLSALTALRVVLA